MSIEVTCDGCGRKQTKPWRDWNALLSELEAARKVVAKQIWHGGTASHCACCEADWLLGDPPRHYDGCEVAEYLRVIEEQGFHPCPKCDGRGFIRTLVDGMRDSEPCSYCRMSGRVMEEQR